MLEWKRNGTQGQGAAGERRGPHPELAERPRRRTFTASYKLTVLRDADACTKPGEVGALLRREGLYTSHLSAWRKQRDDGALKALSKPRGRPKPDPSEAQIERCVGARSEPRPSWRRRAG